MNQKFIHRNIYFQVNSSTAVTATTSGKARGLLKLLKQKEVMLYTYFLADVLNILTKLSSTFQQADCCAADIHGNLERTIKALERYMDK